MLPADHDALDRALRRLPLPRAPHTLLPRVLAAAGAWAARPWYRRAWLTWPTAWQAASCALFALVLAGAAWALPMARSFAQDAAAGLPLGDLAAAGAAVTRIDRMARETGATIDAIGVTWRLLVLPGIAYGFGLLTLMCALCTAFSTALNRLPLGKALR
jgi:hypothetical protein